MQNGTTPTVFSIFPTPQQESFPEPVHQKGFSILQQSLRDPTKYPRANVELQIY